MRKWVFAGAAAAVAVLSVLPMAATATAAPARAHAVLTIKKVGGPNVKVKAVLQASLKKKTKAIFSTSNPSGKLSCSKSTVTEKVVKNPNRPGTATLSLTKQTFPASSCTLVVAGINATVNSVKINKLPYKVTISDKKGNPVTVFGPSTTFKATALGMSVSCTYTAKSIKGSVSNKTQLVTFKNQKFTVKPGSNSICPKTGSFSAAYGPTLDTSVRGKPHVFVN